MRPVRSGFVLWFLNAAPADLSEVTGKYVRLSPKGRPSPGPSTACEAKAPAMAWCGGRKP
jgi:hypothetical protein